MDTPSDPKQLNPEVLDALREVCSRVQLPGTATRLWNRVLSDDDKQQLGGDLEAAYKKLGTVGMWMEVRHVSAEKALVEVAQRTDFLDEPTTTWLLREIGDMPPQPGRPFWDAASGELRLGDEVIRKVRVMKRPSNIQQILDAFQAAEWLTRIDNPMFRGGHYTPNEPQIRDAVYSLNNGLEKIRFHAQEGGRAVTWERS